MAEPSFEVTAKFLRDMAEIKKLVLGNTRTRRKKPRRRRGSGGGGSGDGPRQWARSLGVTAATDNLAPGTGSAELLDGSGALTGQIISVTNILDIAYPGDAMLRLNGTHVEFGTCGPYVNWV